MEKNVVNILMNDYQNAPENSVLIKRGKKWISITFDELVKDIYIKLNAINDLKSSVTILEKNYNQLKIYSKSHFMVVFNSFKIKVLSGLIDANDDLLDLDSKVLNDEITVKDAIELHSYLQYMFKKLYIDNSSDALSEV